MLCYQFGGASRSGLKPPGSPDNWRCIALDKLNGVELLEGRMANSSEPFAPGVLYRRCRR